MPVACPIERQTTRTSGHSRTARHAFRLDLCRLSRSASIPDTEEVARRAGLRYFSSAKLRRRVSPLGEPPRAAEIRSHDQSAARASRTATLSAFCAVRRASAAFLISSSTVVIMPHSMAQNVAQVEASAGTAAGAAKGRDLSPFSHGLTGRCWTMAPVPDTQQDAELRIRIPAH